jgi:hypothetical protein
VCDQQTWRRGGSRWSYAHQRSEERIASLEPSSSSASSR